MYIYIYVCRYCKCIYTYQIRCSDLFLVVCRFQGDSPSATNGGTEATTVRLGRASLQHDSAHDRKLSWEWCMSRWPMFCRGGGGGYYRALCPVGVGAVTRGKHRRHVQGTVVGKEMWIVSQGQQCEIVLSTLPRQQVWLHSDTVDGGLVNIFEFISAQLRLILRLLVAHMLVAGQFTSRWVGQTDEGNARRKDSGLMPHAPAPECSCTCSVETLSREDQRGAMRWPSAPRAHARRNCCFDIRTRALTNGIQHRIT